MEERSMFPGFSIKTEEGDEIRFLYYLKEAPHTSTAFEQALPFTRYFFQARVSGQEIWTDQGIPLEIIQENSSVFVTVGEIAIGPGSPARNKIAGSIGIFYGEGKLLDCGNIFARVLDEDLPLLAALGDKAWRKGPQLLYFEKPAATGD